MQVNKLVTALILTYNEEIHIQRCIDSLKPFVKEIVVVDSFSQDGTIDILKNNGVKVLQNKFINYAKQFQWGLDNYDFQTPWIMRMDADEYILPELSEEILSRLPNLEMNINGIYLKRRVFFMDTWIKHGGYYPMQLLRLWRNGQGKIEERWMDEHIKLENPKTILFENDLVDDNLNNLTWWTEKHNKYATREAVDLLNKKHNIFQESAIEAKVSSLNQVERRRWSKDVLYVNMPLFVRPFLYFFYRYFLKLGFLEGYPGLIWHFLQGFWYRFLADAKVFQIERYAKKHSLSIKETLETYYKFPI